MFQERWVTDNAEFGKSGFSSASQPFSFRGTLPKFAHRLGNTALEGPFGVAFSHRSRCRTVEGRGMEVWREGRGGRQVADSWAVGSSFPCGVAEISALKIKDNKRFGGASSRLVWGSPSTLPRSSISDGRTCLHNTPLALPVTLSRLTAGGGFGGFSVRVAGHGKAQRQRLMLLRRNARCGFAAWGYFLMADVLLQEMFRGSECC